ncbi:MAG: substrate-binding domain-containing protein [Ignisphaera sp.]|nr:substrate-binding domain-containing protein [Ignisphaera sp.]MDW8084713.1 substrate-binding domain-containing protein [Ignisphaera sp.]
MKRRYAVLVGFTLLLPLIYYMVHPIQPEARLRVAVTSSLYATGLLDYVAKKFKDVHPDVEVLLIPVGSGAALRYAERGDACAIIVHEPTLEKSYLDRKVIEGQRILAVNYFIIAGPRSDPANISRARDVVDAFRRIYDAGERGLTYFISRADDSATYIREIKMWRSAGVSPTNRRWYVECGCGMDQALIMASELKGYILSDVGTYTALRARGRIQDIDVLYNGSTDTMLLNVYSGYIAKRCGGVEREYADLFLDFIYSNPDIVDRFGVKEYGSPLFYSTKLFGDRIVDLWRGLALGE